MKNFMKWLADEAPDYVVVLVIVVIIASTLTLMTISVMALSAGLWIVPVLIWITIPSLAIMIAYNRRD